MAISVSKAAGFVLAKPFRAQPIALRATIQDGVYGIYFSVQQIATIDLTAMAASACWTCGHRSSGDAHRS